MSEDLVRVATGTATRAEALANARRFARLTFCGYQEEADTDVDLLDAAESLAGRAAGNYLKDDDAFTAEWMDAFVAEVRRLVGPEQS